MLRKQTQLAKEWQYSNPFISCRWDRSGRFIYTSATDNRVQSWSLDAETPVSVVEHDSWVSALAPVEGSRLYTGTYRGDFLSSKIDVKTVEPLQTQRAHDGWVRSAVVSPEGQRMATVGNDRSVRIWSTSEGSVVRTLDGHEDEVYSACFSPDGKHLVSGDLKGALRVWNVDSGQLERTLDASQLHHYDPAYRARFGGARRLAFSPDGRWLACGGPGENIFSMAGEFKPAVLLYDWASGEQKAVMKADDVSYQGNICGLAFHPSGFLIGAGGGKSGGRIWFWNLDATVPFHTIELPTTAKDFDLHPDGELMLVAHYEGKPVRNVTEEIGGALRVYSM